MSTFIFTKPDGSTFECEISLEGAYRLANKRNLTYKRKEKKLTPPTVPSKLTPNKII